MARGFLRTLLGAMALVAALATGNMVTGGAAMAATAHDFTFDKIDGGALPMSQFKGKTVLVVNTASFCGYTPQYEGLEALWKKYKDKGLVIVGVPANNFGGQEPGSNAEIQTFCTAKYDVDFPMAAKVSVTGGDAHPFYKWARDTLGASKAPQWNFHKYLVSADGTLLDAFPSAVEPDSHELTHAIDKALAK
jgi:glutathione peroxidase